MGDVRARFRVPKAGLGSAIALLMACAHGHTSKSAGAAASAAASPQPAEVDVASQLMQSLPLGADRCVAARPGKLPAEQRVLFAQLAQSEPWVWPAELKVLAYAAARTVDGERRGAQVTVLRLGSDAQSARRFLSQHAGVSLRWEQTPTTQCLPSACPMLARFVDEHTLRLTRGLWSVMGKRGVGAECLRLLHDHPDAIEVSVRHEPSLFVDGPSQLPVQTAVVALSSAHSVLLAADELMASTEAAARAVERAQASAGLASGLSGIESSIDSSQQDLLVHTTTRIAWDDLRLRDGDNERHLRAQRYAEALLRVREDSAVDLTNVPDVVREVEARRAVLENSGADPQALAAEIVAFLDRALAVHEADPRLLELRQGLLPVALQPGVTTPGQPAMTPP